LAGNLRDFALREADDQQAAAPGQRAHRNFGVLTAHRVVDDVDAAALSEGSDRFTEIGRRVIEYRIGTALGSRLQLLFARRGSNHACAGDFSKLDRGQPYAASCPEHEQRLARRERARLTSACCDVA
jgi:hypothetical protein